MRADSDVRVSWVVGTIMIPKHTAPLITRGSIYDVAILTVVSLALLLPTRAWAGVALASTPFFVRDFFSFTPERTFLTSYF